MGRFIISALISVSLACITPKNTFMNASNLNGVWIPVRQEIAGKDLPNAAFENYKLTISEDTVYTYGNDTGTLNYNNGKMDIYGHKGPNQGKHITAIYKLEDEQLTICYNLSGDSYPNDYETKSKPMLFLSVYKKGQ